MIESLLQIVQQVALGSASAAGAEVGQAIASAIRNRLGGTDRGREALDSLDQQPEDPATVAAVGDLLRAEVDADPAFAERLSALLAQQRPAGPARVTTGSITLDGTTVRGRNTISLGPVSISNTRNVRLSLMAAAVTFVGLVGLGVYGGVRLANGPEVKDRPPQTAATNPSGGESPSRRAARPEWEPTVTALPASALLSVLPAPSEVPPYLTYHSEPDSITFAKEGKWGKLATAFVFYNLKGSQNVTFWLEVTSYINVSKAKTIWPFEIERVRDYSAPFAGSDLPQWTTKALPPPDVGDESWMGSATPSKGPEGERIGTVARVGSVTVAVTVRGVGRSPSDKDFKAVGAKEMTDLLRLLALRAENVQKGQLPAA
ncbi:hypothetical protein OG754_00965 [Streptomyces decoyicus]|uniref:hypothetical protein n=1 Tax=Streptomyces decoyicus TaxID=249567 RepID=UPI002E36FF77|nr:hypothetical protein [Streptomyces decoyicus]